MRNIIDNWLLNIILLFTIIGEFFIPWVLELHSAAPNGSWCGDQRQLSAANGTLN